MSGAPDPHSPDRYAVLGNPVEHSRSPFIHARFAEQTGERIDYGRILAPLDGFAATVVDFRAAGGRGCNVTVPFKTEAFALSVRRSERAQAAGAVNTLRFDEDGAFGDNTDGIGLVRDLGERHGWTLAGARLLLLGAGGATRGVLLPLLQAGVSRLWIANRTVERAQALADLVNDPRVTALRLSDLGEGAALPDADLVINATSAGLSGQALPVSPRLLARSALVYDMLYGAAPTPFMRAALAAGAGRVVDGLGMLVEQAAESFRIWRGCMPDTEPVYRALRVALETPPPGR